MSTLLPVFRLVSHAARCVRYAGAATIVIVLMLLLPSPLLASSGDGAGGAEATFIEQLTGSFTPPLHTHPLGLAYEGPTQQFFLSCSRAVGTRVLLSGSSDGLQQLVADDVVSILFTDASGAEWTWRHDFARADGQGIAPFGPVDISAVVPCGMLEVRVALMDVLSPNAFLQPIWLVVTTPRKTAVGSSGRRGDDGGDPLLSPVGKPPRFRIDWAIAAGGIIGVLVIAALAGRLLLARFDRPVERSLKGIEGDLQRGANRDLFGDSDFDDFGLDFDSIPHSEH